jgi:membrane fusion protein, multidrug efflux system
MRRIPTFSLLLLSVSVLSACSDDQAAAPATPPPPEVSVVTVYAESIPVTSELPGRIAPTRIAEVRPRASGIVVEQVFQQGSDVKAGDVLYRIDPEPFKLRVESARASVQRAEATRLQAQQQAARTRELREKAVSSAQALETSEATLAQAQADLASANAELSTAMLDLEYSEVKAPISGRIGRALITEGALVSANGTESLATIQQLDPVYADFTQSANDLMALRRALQKGTVGDADSDEANARLVFDDGSIYAHPGRLLFSESAVDATTGQVTLRAEFPNGEGDLLPGMYVRVQIEQGIQKDAIAIPQQAIQRDTAGKGRVYIVDAESTVSLRSVTPGRIVGGRWVIQDGLNPGDRVLVEGFQKVSPGAKVQAKEWEGRAALIDERQGN